MHCLPRKRAAILKRFGPHSVISGDLGLIHITRPNRVQKDRGRNKEMMEHDINIAKRDALVKEHGFEAPDFNE